jgi:RNA polymerase sigma factor (sigma-70 family)
VEGNETTAEAASVGAAMTGEDPRSDDQLIAAARSDPEAFGVFYARHLQAVIGFFMARIRDPELAADLASETFAAALLAVRRFRQGDASGRTWLYAIARHKLIDSMRRGQVEASARRKLGIPPLALDDEDIARIEEMAGPSEGPLELLADLPDDVRAALSARVLDEREYPDIASELSCSEALVRQRVSRGLSRLRRRLGEKSE